MVECLLMVRQVIGLILHGGPIEVFFDPASVSTTGITKAIVCVILSLG